MPTTSLDRSRLRAGAAGRVQGATRVLIAGGGVAALEAALALRALAAKLVTVELLAPEPYFWYRPLAVAQPFRLGEARHFELSDLAAGAGATFTPGRIVAVDSRRRLAHTAAGPPAIAYDVLLVACGAVPTPAIPGALTFRDATDAPQVARLLDEAVAGKLRRIAFAVPCGAAWSLPAYELALLTARHLRAHGRTEVELALVTPEHEPLQVFGRAAVEALRELLEACGIAVSTGACPAEFARGELRLVPGGRMPADRVVALPRLRGRRIDGLPQTVDGFLPVDPFGRVRGVDGVFAAGDVTAFPVKQGGIAAQQADAAAETIAADAGADLRPDPFRPVLRGLLLTGAQSRYFRHQLTGGLGDVSTASTEPLWWPPDKIVGRYLAPFLGTRAGVEVPPETPVASGAVPVEVRLDSGGVARLAPTRLELAGSEAAGGRTVADEMSAQLVAVAPEDTLGEVAEKMRGRDLGSAVVLDHGRLIGILTSRDLLRAFAGRVHSSDARVREWMTAEPATVSPQTRLEVAATLMIERGFHHLPVVEGERVVGMLGLRQAVRRRRERIAVGLGF